MRAEQDARQDKRLHAIGDSGCAVNSHSRRMLKAAHLVKLHQLFGDDRDACARVNDEVERSGHAFNLNLTA